eukprot:IDg11127t1
MKSDEDLVGELISRENADSCTLKRMCSRYVPSGGRTSRLGVQVKKFSPFTYTFFTDPARNLSSHDPAVTSLSCTHLLPLLQPAPSQHSHCILKTVIRVIALLTFTYFQPLCNPEVRQFPDITPQRAPLDSVTSGLATACDVEMKILHRYCSRGEGAWILKAVALQGTLISVWLMRSGLRV